MRFLGLRKPAALAGLFAAGLLGAAGVASPASVGRAVSDDEAARLVGGSVPCEKWAIPSACGGTFPPLPMCMFKYGIDTPRPRERPKVYARPKQAEDVIPCGVDITYCGVVYKKNSCDGLVAE